MHRLLTDSTKGFVNNPPATLFLIVLRLCWLGVFAPLAVGVPIVAIMYLSSFHGLGLVVREIILILLYIFTIIPSLVIGFLPISVIDKKPLIVLVFYKVTVPLLLGLLLLAIWSSISWYSVDTQNAKHPLADTQFLIALILGFIVISAIVISIISIARSPKGIANPQMVNAKEQLEPITCMNCGAVIEPDAEKCKLCGWSYKR